MNTPGFSPQVRGMIPTLAALALASAMLIASACGVGCQKKSGPVTAGTTTEYNADATTSDAPAEVTPVDPVSVPEGKNCVDSVGHEYPDGYKYAVGTKANATHFECRDGQFVELEN